MNRLISSHGFVDGYGEGASASDPLCPEVCECVCHVFFMRDTRTLCRRLCGQLHMEGQVRICGGG